MTGAVCTETELAELVRVRTWGVTCCVLYRFRFSFIVIYIHTGTDTMKYLCQEHSQPYLTKDIQTDNSVGPHTMWITQDNPHKTIQCNSVQFKKRTVLISTYVSFSTHLKQPDCLGEKTITETGGVWFDALITLLGWELSFMMFSVFVLLRTLRKGWDGPLWSTLF